MKIPSYLSTIIILVSFGIYGYIHTILASSKVKTNFSNNPYYRLFYNAQSVILLIPILALIVLLPDNPVYQMGGLIKNILLSIQVISIISILISVWQTGILDFIGIPTKASAPKKSKLQISGFYNWMRHPIYTFTILFFWSSPTMTSNTIALAIAATLYCFIGSIYEEIKLVNEFGEAYINYQNSVKRFIPFIF